jgi:hypothetical protein
VDKKVPYDHFCDLLKRPNIASIIPFKMLKGMFDLQNNYLMKKEQLENSK